MPSIVKLTLESNQYERGIKNAQKSWNDFMRGIGMSPAKFTAVGAAIGAVSAALKVSKDAFFANEQQLDNWNRSVQSAKSVYNGFLNALNTGDISGFLSKIDQIVSAAKDAYNALDELNTFKAFNQVQDARGRANYAKALDDYKLNPTAENKAALDAANEAVKKNLQAQRDFTLEAYTKGLESLASERQLTGINESQFVEMFKNKSYAELKAIKKQYEEGKAGSTYFFGNRVLGSYIQDRGTGAWNKMSEKDAQDFRFAQALNQLNDEQIKAVQSLGAQAEQLDEAIWQQDRAFNRLAGNNGKSGGGGGGKGGGGNNTVFAADSIMAQEKLVAELTTKWKTAGAAVRDDYAKALGEAQFQLDRMTGKEGFDPSKLTPISGSANLTQGAELAIPERLNIESPYQKLTTEIQRLKGEMDGLWDPTAIEIYNQRITELQKEQAKYTDQVVDGGKQSAKAYSKAASGISTVSMALNSIDDPGAKILATIGQAIATVAMAYSEALLKDGGIKSNIWAFIAAAAAATVSMATTIASIHSATGYAQGGIVKGNSYSGDNMMAQGPGGELVGLNAGEVVLTRAMASNLANSLQSPMSMMRIVGEVQGERIVLVANRFLKRSGQGEIVTW